MIAILTIFSAHNNIKDSSLLIEDEIFNVQLDKPIRLNENGEVESALEPRDFPCLICPAAFKRYSHLKQHELLHMNQQDWNDQEKPECDICKKAFGSVSALNLHKKLHENRFFKCNICQLEVSTGRFHLLITN